MIPNFQKQYKDTIREALKEELGFSSVMQVPKLEKIVLNMGVNDSLDNEKNLDNALEQMTQIAGQRAVKTTAKKSISAFKLREGMKIGCKVNLRRQRMYEFMERLVKIALPRVRDFKGVSPKSFDGRGNYALGIKEQLIFPEIVYDKVDRIRGMDIIIVTSAKNDDHARKLLEKFGMPFQKSGKQN